MAKKYYQGIFIIYRNGGRDTKFNLSGTPKEIDEQIERLKKVAKRDQYIMMPTPKTYAEMAMATYPARGYHWTIEVVEIREISHEITIF